MVGEVAELGIVEPCRVRIGQGRGDPRGRAPEGAAEGGLVRRRVRGAGESADNRVGRSAGRHEGGAQALDLLSECAVALPEFRRLVGAHEAPPDRTDAIDGRGRADSMAGRRLIPALLQNRPALASAPRRRGGGTVGRIVSAAAGPAGLRSQ
ncbi:hypothetical protein ACU4GR_28590, partial [Methylobacterium oryzae CBMB20]